MQRQHHSSGVPREVHGHQPKVTTREVQAIHGEGLLTATVVARELGIGATTLCRLEGKLFGPVPRRGKRCIRVFTPEQVERIRGALRTTTRLGAGPKLLSFEEVARRGRYGCTRCRHLRRSGSGERSGRGQRCVGRLRGPPLVEPQRRLPSGLACGRLSPVTSDAKRPAWDPRPGA